VSARFRGDVSPEELVGRNVTVDPSGCWIWGDDPEKYGNTSTPDFKIVVHRFVYETLVGPIPAGHHLHHKCEVKACCNPDHLEPLTPAEHSAAHRESRAESISSPA